MRTSAQNAFHNIGVVFASNLGDGALRFFISILIARFFLVSEYGFLNFVFAWVSYLVLLSDFGLQQILVREIAHRREDVSPLFANGSFVRLILSVVLIVIGGGIVFLFSGYSAWKVALVALALLTLLINSVNPGSLYDAFNLSRYDALFRFLGTGFYTAAAVVALILLGIKSLPLIVLLSILSQFIYIVTGNVFFHKRIHRIHPSFSLPVMKRLIGEGKTIVWARLMAQVYTNMDLIMISLLVGDKQTGYYAIAYKLLFAAMALNTAIHRVFLPIIAEVRDNIGGLKVKLEAMGKILSFVSMPIAILGIAFADRIVLLFYTAKYSPSILVLRILLIYVVLVGIGSIYGLTLFSLGDNRKYATGITLGAIVNIALNFVFIPLYGFVGTGVATIISQAVVVAYTFFQLRKILKIAVAKNIFLFGALSLLSALIGFCLSEYAGLHFLVAVAICGIVYIFVCMFSGAISRDELAIVGINWHKK